VVSGNRADTGLSWWLNKQPAWPRFNSRMCQNFYCMCFEMSDRPQAAATSTTWQPGNCTNHGIQTAFLSLCLMSICNKLKNSA